MCLYQASSGAAGNCIEARGKCEVIVVFCVSIVDLYVWFQFW